MCVRQHQKYTEKDRLTETEERVMQLISDYAILDRPNQSYKIGQVVRITNQGKNSSTKNSCSIWSRKQEKHYYNVSNVWKYQTKHVYRPVYSTLGLPFGDIITRFNVTIKEVGV